MQRDFCEPFRGKKITVAGLGLLGRGVGDAAFLAECGASLVVTDLKSEEDLRESTDKLKHFPNVSFVLGEHRLEDFQDKDFILRGAGVPSHSPYIDEARKRNIPIEMSASLFARLAGIPIVGVTGTRGKSTITHMIADVLKASGQHVLLGGNVRGVATLPLLKEVRAQSIGVFELDSWQLQGFGESKISPNISVFATLYPDHMNYYKGDMDAYLQDKANIFLYQKQDDTLIVGSQALGAIEKYKKDIHGTVVVADEAGLPTHWKLAIPGDHNRYNASLALEAVRALGVSDEVSKKALEAFKGLPGRIELLREINGLKFYNDTNATSPDATLASLKTLHKGAPNTILIMGGADKGLDMGGLLEVLPTYCKTVVLLPGTGTEKLHLEPATYTLIKVFSLKEALEMALKKAERGDTILFSPAFASFGLFKNEYDRGDQFTKLVNEI
ncbi:MAG: UDP-N-acetylmuramoyl-L-alanine--D-glutamate ligase [Parcubacteria group bacterium]|nr:UDP-N-acetylmuramoyl-L-alanine--D-glutamate ligase [Parcubacteria group bacterium]